MMQARSKLKPGQPGTKKLVEQYGAELVCVRYRYDDQRGKRYKTVELIIEESAYAPPSKLNPDTIVGSRIALTEAVLQKKVKHAGGTWNRSHQLWEIRYDRVVKLGLMRGNYSRDFFARAFSTNCGKGQSSNNILWLCISSVVILASHDAISRKSALKAKDLTRE